MSVKKLLDCLLNHDGDGGKEIYSSAVSVVVQNHSFCSIILI
jgi:hypothetical protein